MTRPDLSANQLDVQGVARLYRALRHFWHPVAYASDLADHTRRINLLGEQLVLVRLSGEVRCFQDLCVHRGTALSLGWVESDHLRCAYHGWTYDHEGACTSIPARFGRNIPKRAHLRPYKAAEKNGLIYVCLEERPVFSLPDFPHHEDPRFRVVQVPSYDWNASAPRRIENYVDFSHFAWVHDGLLGDRDHPEVPDHDVHREGGELRFEYSDYAFSRSQRDTQEHAGMRDEAGEAVTTPMKYRLFMPNTVLLEQSLPDRQTYVLFFSVCPTGPDTVRSFTFIARNYQLGDDADAADQKLLEFNDLVVGQDKPIVESQRPEELPFDLSAELHIKGVDRVSLEYRRWLVELAKDLEARTGRRQ